jgi:hypothetical protein
LASIVIPPRGLAYNPSAITDQDIYVWASHAIAPGELRGSFEHFRAFPIDAEQNKETAKSKITTPVLALGGDIYPALGGDYPGNFAYSSLQSLASNVTGIKTLYSWRTAKICNRSALNFSSNFLGTVLTTVKEHCHFSNRRF